jgi:hypothetical protein
MLSCTFVLMLPHDGYIKYSLHWNEAPTLSVPASLIDTRNLLAQQGWIGVYPDGIGFGNISVREPGSDGFFISGTQTGHILMADAMHFCKVEDSDISNNTIWCSGPIKASSEALTHAAFYAANPEVQAVIHVHHRDAWHFLLHKIPTVPEDIAYGTPDMASTVQELMLKNGDKFPGVIVTAGHQDGIFAYGDDLKKVYAILSEAIQRSSTNNG